MISLKRLLIVVVALLTVSWGFIGIQHYRTPVYEGTAITQSQNTKTCPCGCGMAIPSGRLDCGCGAGGWQT